MKFAGVKDRLNLLSKLNAGRLLNFLKLKLSYQLSKFTRKPVYWGKPWAFAFEPTTACNLHCPECPSGLRQFTRTEGNAGIEVFEKALQEFGGQAFYLTLYFQGEPFIHRGIFEMISKAKTRNLYVSTSTNAHFLSPEYAEKTVASGLDRIIISLDGLTQETYEKYRVGGDLQKVLEGIDNLVAAKKKARSSTPYIVLQFLVFSHNEHELPGVKKLKERLGVDRVAIKTAQVYNPENSDLLPRNQSWSRYKKDKSGNYALKGKAPNRCFRLWGSPVLTHDGQVLPCCFDKDAKHPMGNITRNSRDEIFYGLPYKKFREQVFSHREQIEICRNCSEGRKVWL